MKLPIVKYGDPVLRSKGKRVAKVDDRIRALASDMLDTMHAANGVGLAAQQVGEPLQLTPRCSEIEGPSSTLDEFWGGGDPGWPCLSFESGVSLRERGLRRRL